MKKIAMNILFKILSDNFKCDPSDSFSVTLFLFSLAIILPRIYNFSGVNLHFKISFHPSVFPQPMIAPVVEKKRTLKNFCCLLEEIMYIPPISICQSANFPLDFSPSPCYNRVIIRLHFSSFKLTSNDEQANQKICRGCGLDTFQLYHSHCRRYASEYYCG